MVRHWGTAFVFLLAALVPGAGLTATQSLKDFTPSAIIVSDHTLTAFQQARASAVAAGGRCLQMFPPDAIFGYFPSRPSAVSFPGSRVGVCFSREDLASRGLDPIVERVVGDLLDQERVLAQKKLEAVAPSAEAGFEDVVLRGDPNLIRGATPSGPRLGAPMQIQDRGPQQNSEFLIGSVLINVIFPESKGGTENWTDAEISNALADLNLGLSQYLQRALWVDLSFMLNFSKFKRVPVTMEPIESDMSTDPIWMGEAMDALGYHHGAYMGAHELNNAARDSLKTEWVFTAFVADMSAHYNPDAPSPDPGCWGGAGYVAYSYLGGPYLLVPYPACRYGYGLGFGRVFIHEMSHTFWALDEYASAAQTCADRSGYLDIANRNTLFEPCQETLPCIMQTAAPPFSSPQPICDYTQAMVGLSDANGNSIPDIYDIAPVIEFSNIPGVTTDTLLPKEEYLLSIVVRNNAVPNKNPEEDPAYRVSYAPYIKSGEMSFNGQPFEPFFPSDGKWDSPYELTATEISSGFVPGLNTFTVRAENRVELSAEATKKVFLIGLKYFQTSATAQNGVIRVAWTTAKETFGATFDVIRTDLTAGEFDKVLATVTQDEGSGLDRRSFGYLDNAVQAGHEYRYRIRGEFSVYVRGEMQSYEFSSDDFNETAIVPIEKSFVSNLLPNPTSGRTTFTIDVPKTFRDPSGNSVRGGPSRAPAVMEVRTRLAIDVYNVSGARVKNIYSDNRFGGIVTFTWDGMDERGEPVPSGVYFLRIEAGGSTDVKKIVILH